MVAVQSHANIFQCLIQGVVHDSICCAPSHLAAWPTQSLAPSSQITSTEDFKVLCYGLIGKLTASPIANFDPCKFPMQQSLLFIKVEASEGTAKLQFSQNARISLDTVFPRKLNSPRSRFARTNLCLEQPLSLFFAYLIH